LTDLVALARTGIASRAALAADPVVALLVAEDIAAGACGELRPAALESPIGGWLDWRSFRGLCPTHDSIIRYGLRHGRG